MKDVWIVDLDCVQNSLSMTCFALEAMQELWADVSGYSWKLSLETISLGAGDYDVVPSLQTVNTLPYSKVPAKWKELHKDHGKKKTAGKSKAGRAKSKEQDDTSQEPQPDASESQPPNVSTSRGRRVVPNKKYAESPKSSPRSEGAASDDSAEPSPNSSTQDDDSNGSLTFY
jgi:hypothetical protein